MIQNIIALTIVFLAAAYTIYAIVRSFVVKKTSVCGSCTGCSLKDKLTSGVCASDKSERFQVRKLNIGVAEIGKTVDSQN